MRIAGALLFLVGSAGTAYAMRESFARPRPIAALFGLLAPLCVAAALLGALLAFVPDFLQ